MALESVTHVGDLVATNPTATDPKQQGDDHLRNLKTALKNSFAGFAGAIVVTGTDGGAVNAYTLTPTTALTAYGARMIALFSPSVTNTGAVTLNISGLGAKSVKSVAGADLVSGELAGGSVYSAVYNGSEFRLLSVTKQAVEQLAFSAALPAQSGNGGKYLKTNGSVASWDDTDSLGVVHLDKGNSGTTAQVIDFTAAESQKLTATGNFTISTTGWPTARGGSVLLKLVNGGAYTLTWTGITWVKSDGTFTTNFSLSGVTLQAAGTDFILFWSDDGGTTVYAKVMR